MTASIIYLVSIIGLASCQELLSNQRCNHSPDRGECTDFIVKWHYDRYAHRCRQFYFGGCGGNENRFDTQEDCEGQCRFIDNSVLERCSQPYDAGHCHSDISRHYFDMNKGACICANYTGCGGNNNMFYSFDQCMSVCGQFAKPNHIQIHDNTPEYSHDGHAQLTPLQLVHKQQTLQHQSHHQRILQHVHNQQQDHHQQRYKELLRHHGEQQRRNHPVLNKPQSPLSINRNDNNNEDIGQMKQKREENTAEFSTGTTTIIRHTERGDQYVTKINGHPVKITEKIMEMVRSGKAESIDDAINQLAASNENLHLASTSSPVPNYVYMNEMRPLNPVYKNIPQVSVTRKTSSSSTYNNLPREAFIRPVDPEERRKWKEKMKKKINPVRRINPSPSTFYEVYTTPEPVEETATHVPETTTTTTRAPTTTTTTPVPETTTTTTTTRAPTTTTTTSEPIRVPETTTQTRPVVPTQHSSFYQESFDLSKMRKHKETVRNGKIPPQRPMDDYEDDRVPYETDINTLAPTVPPTVPPTTTRSTVVLPVSREELAPTAHTEKVLPSVVIPTGTHFDLEEGKEEEEYEEYDEEDDGEEEELSITHRIEPTTTSTPLTTTTSRPTPRPLVPLVTVTPTFASRSKEAMEKPLQLVPPSYDQTTSTTTTTERTRVTTPRPRITTTEAPESTVAATRKSLWGSYESEEFDIRPASRGSI